MRRILFMIVFFFPFIPQSASANSLQSINDKLDKCYDLSKVVGVIEVSHQHGIRKDTTRRAIMLNPELKIGEDDLNYALERSWEGRIMESAADKATAARIVKSVFLSTCIKQIFE